MVELNTWHRGRLIDHIQLVVADFDACRRFYSAVFDALGVRVRHLPITRDAIIAAMEQT